MRMGGGDESAFSLSEQQLAMAGRDGQSPFGIEIELACALEHARRPRKYTKTHFAPQFPTVYAWIRPVKPLRDFFSMVTKVYGNPGAKIRPYS